MSGKRKLRIGYVGWAMRHDGPETESVAWCNTDEPLIKRLAAENPDIKTFTDWRQMLAECDLDMVVVSPPNHFHAEIAIAALDAGKHVFLEKPMGITRAECDAILEAKKRGGGELAIDFEVRVSPCANRLQEAIKSGRYGEVRRLEYVHHQGQWTQNETRDHWRVRRDTAGSKMLECTIHYIDLMRLLAGSEVVSVQATAGPNVLPQYEFEDNTFAHLFFANGVLGTIHNTHTHSAVPPRGELWQNNAQYMSDMGHYLSLFVTLTGGSIHVDLVAEKITFNRFEEYPVGSGGVRSVQDLVEHYDHAADIFYHDSNIMRWKFIRQVLSGEQIVQDPFDAWRSHMICFAVDESLANDFKRVAVDYTPPKGY